MIDEPEKISETNGKKPKENSRRSFLHVLWIILGFAAIAEIAWVVISFLRPGTRQRPKASANSIFEAGRVEQFARDSVTAFVGGLAVFSALGFLATPDAG